MCSSRLAEDGGSRDFCNERRELMSGWARGVSDWTEPMVHESSFRPDVWTRVGRLPPGVFEDTGAECGRPGAPCAVLLPYDAAIREGRAATEAFRFV